MAPLKPCLYRRRSRTYPFCCFLLVATSYHVLSIDKEHFYTLSQRTSVLSLPAASCLQPCPLLFTCQRALNANTNKRCQCAICTQIIDTEETFKSARENVTLTLHMLAFKCQYQAETLLEFCDNILFVRTEELDKGTSEY